MINRTINNLKSINIFSAFKRTEHFIQPLMLWDLKLLCPLLVYFSLFNFHHHLMELMCRYTQFLLLIDIRISLIRHYIIFNCHIIAIYLQFAISHGNFPFAISTTTKSWTLNSLCLISCSVILNIFSM